MTTTGTVDGAVARREQPRLQLWGGVAAALGAVLTTVPLLLPVLRLGFAGMAQPVAVVIGAALLVASAALLVKAMVGDRARFGWAKLGGILLIIFHTWWLVLLLIPQDGLLLLIAFSGEASTVTRALVALLAGIAIARRWPLRGFNRWSMLLVAAAFAITNYGVLALLLSVGGGAAEWAVALSMLYPLALLAFGIGHAVAGWRASRAAA